MNIKVRYYSRSGNTKLLANAIAKGINVDEEYIYAKNKPSEDFLKQVENDVKKYL